MSEQYIINLLNNININEVLVLINMPTSIKNSVAEYAFQAVAANKEIIDGKIDVFNNGINISYSNQNNLKEKHLFSNTICYYNPSNYSVYSKHVLLTEQQDIVEEQLLEEQSDNNTQIKDFFKFKPKQIEENGKQKILV